MSAKGVVKDTTTGLYCTSYSTDVSLCQWGNDDLVLFPNIPAAESAAADMNTQLSLETPRFIGTNPPPH